MSKAQFKLNNEIIALIGRKKAENAPFNESEISLVQSYTGSGGLISQGAKGRGVLYEYYTPYPIIEAMWSLAYSHGFTSGKILEPSLGIGRMLRYVDPANNTVVAYEWSGDNNTTSYDIATITYPWAKITNNYFESYFYDGNTRMKREADFDLIIGNPPYGKFDGFYSKSELKIFKHVSTYDAYFLCAGLELLKQNGLLVFIMPSSFIDNMTVEMETWIDERAELLEAWRLPINVFDFTQIGTDIIVFKKK